MTNTSKKPLLYSNPYQNEIWEIKKEKDEIDNEIVYALAKIIRNQKEIIEKLDILIKSIKTV